MRKFTNTEKKRFNIAYLPTTRSMDLIALAQSLAGYANSYLLGSTSLPHITLSQFHVTEQETKTIWNQTIRLIRLPKINLRLEKFSCITFDEIDHWTSLLPNPGPVLFTQHKLVQQLLGLPENRCYDPHLTLINSKTPSSNIWINRLTYNFQPIDDIFTLILGSCDELGQFTHMIKSIK